MEKAVSIADAKRNFFLILRHVCEGRSYVVTIHGRPVARVIPASKREIGSSARTALLSRLESQAGVDIGGWTRAELYNDRQ